MSHDTDVLSTYTLSHTESEKVRTISETIIPAYVNNNYTEFSNACWEAHESIPRSVKQWVDTVCEKRVGVLKNLPIDSSLPSTPTKKRAAHDHDLLADRVLGLISSMFGRIYTLAERPTQWHIHDIYPVEDDAFMQLGSNKIDLEWHVETGVHAHRPNWVVLLCLRGAPDAYTYVARAQDLSLSAELIDFLEQHQFKIQVDDTIGNSTKGYVTTSILQDYDSDPKIIFDPDYTLPRDDREQDAINSVTSAVNSASTSYILEKGDLLILDNRRTVHARSSYSPDYDGSDRWLKRVFLIDHPPSIDKLKNGVIEIEYI